jgi:chromosome segregation ATPase
MPHDDLDHIPSIVPTRDGVPERGTGRARSGRNEGGRKAGSPKPVDKSGDAGLMGRVIVVISLVAGVAACVWAWQLQSQLLNAQDQLEQYSTRIGDLEARLSDTDQGMNQNAEVQAVKLAEMEKEVRKLWDNVWKESKERLAKLESAGTSQNQSIKTVQSALSSTQSQSKETSGQVAKLTNDIAELKGIAGDLARLMSSAKANQAEVERVADSLNRINLILSRLEKRVAGNEEWVASINAFRKQVNTSLGELQAAIRNQQAPR